MKKYKKAIEEGRLEFNHAENFENITLTFKGAAAKDFHLRVFVFCSMNKNYFIRIKDLTKYPKGENLELQYYGGDRYSSAAYTYGEKKPKKIDWI